MSNFRSKRLPTLKELVDHVHQLCGAFDIELRVSNIGKSDAAALTMGFFDRKTKELEKVKRIVVIAPIEDEAMYAVALHELGHLIHPSGTLQSFDRKKEDFGLKITEETCAWEWAHDHALDWTPAMEQVRAIALGRYKENDQQYRHLQRTLGPAFDAILKALGAIGGPQQGPQGPVNNDPRPEPPRRVEYRSGSLKDFAKGLKK